MSNAIETATDIALAQLSCVASEFDDATSVDARLKVANAAIRLTQALTRDHGDLEALPDTFASPSGHQTRPTVKRRGQVGRTPCLHQSESEGSPQK